MIGRYMRWLHTGWPAGTVEKLPEVNADGTTAVPGVRVVGDLTGIPLLKFSADTGARAVHAVTRELGETRGGDSRDLVIVGAGVAGVSAAIEASKAGLDYVLYEAAQTFSTVVNFPKGKPIFTYPTDMTPSGDLQFTADVKEDLVAEMEQQRARHGIEPVAARVEKIARKGGELLVHLAGEREPVRAKRVIIAIGRSGNFRKLGVPGEDLDKVYNRLHDPQEFAGKCVLVVGGGDSALETAIATARAGANVVLSYRKPEFSRPKPDNVDAIEQLATDPAADVGVEEPSSERVTTAYTSNICGRGSQSGSITLALATQVVEIRADEVDLKDANGEVRTLPNDVVFSMIGREPPLDFFRRSGIPIRGEWRMRQYLGFTAFFAFCVFLYHWKSATSLPFTDFSLNTWFQQRGWFPFNVGAWWERISAATQVKTSLLYTLKTSMSSPGFYYTLAYCLCVVIFGIARMRRRRTPYVTVQTLTLMAIQCIPLFILPELVLPWMGRNGWFEQGTTLGAVADQFFEPYDAPNADQLAAAGAADLSEWSQPIGHERAYWRAYGFILAWPLFVWNFFTEAPMWGWLIVGEPANLCADSADHSPLGQGSVLRVDLFVRSAGRDAGRHPSAQDAPRPQVEPGQHARPGVSRLRSGADAAAHRQLGRSRQRRRRDLRCPAQETPGGQLQVAGRSDVRRGDWGGLLFLVQRAGLVPVRVPAGRADAHLRPVHPLPDFRQQEKVHLLQRVYLGLPPGHRRDELCQQGAGHGRPGMRSV
jgi:NosR/NirI family nitrous oxide reductase transcriptional regulator